VYLPKTEIRLDVQDAERSVAFYQALLGAAPARRTPAEAVFECAAPPLVLTLDIRPRASRGRRPTKPADLAFALVVAEPESVGKAAVALWRAGARLRLLDQGIEATDPDGVPWLVRFEPSAKARAVTAMSIADRPLFVRG
jgi:catechol 2,3-dioxygenase-like lactoylglutathione lyase family enzyme